MGMFDKVLKNPKVGKAIQTVQAQAQKPENRAKIEKAMTQLKNRRPGTKRPPQV
jgi:hypothetical protein